jgi:hypothetical protein
MSSIPPPLPGPTEVDPSDALKKAAINFAYFPNNAADREAMKMYGNVVFDHFSKNYLKRDAETTAMAAVTLYLKNKTDPSKRGGTRHSKKRLRKTRKHRKM